EPGDERIGHCQYGQTPRRMAPAKGGSGLEAIAMGFIAIAQGAQGGARRATEVKPTAMASSRGPAGGSPRCEIHFDEFPCRGRRPMPTLLADPTRTMYIVFGAMVVILGAMALRRQKKVDVITFVISAVLLLALFLIDWAYESPREKVVRTLEEMKSASQARNYDDVFKHISNDFKYKSLDKKAFRERATIAEGY